MIKDPKHEPNAQFVKGFDTVTASMVIKYMTAEVKRTGGTHEQHQMVLLKTT